MISLRSDKEEYLQVSNPRMVALYVVPYIKHYPGKEIKYQRETYRKKGRVNKE